MFQKTANKDKKDEENKENLGEIMIVPACRMKFNPYMKSVKQ